MSFFDTPVSPPDLSILTFLPQPKGWLEIKGFHTHSIPLMEQDVKNIKLHAFESPTSNPFLQTISSLSLLFPLKCLFWIMRLLQLYLIALMYSSASNLNLFIPSSLLFKLLRLILYIKVPRPLSGEKGGPHTCVCCKSQLENFTQSRPISKSQASMYGLSEADIQATDRVCVSCKSKAVRRRTKSSQCPIPTCPAKRSRIKRLRPFPAKWVELEESRRSAIIAKYRKGFKCL